MAEQETHSPSEFDAAMDNIDAVAGVLMGLAQRAKRLAGHRANITPRGGWEPREAGDDPDLVDPERGGIDPRGEFDDLGAPEKSEAQAENVSLLSRLSNGDPRLTDEERAEAIERFGFDEGRPLDVQAERYLREQWSPTATDAWIDRMRVYAEAITNEAELGEDDLRKLVDDHGLVQPGDPLPNGQRSEASVADQARSALAGEWGLDADSPAFAQVFETARLMRDALMFEEYIAAEDLATLQGDYGFDEDRPLHEQAREWMIENWFPAGRPDEESQGSVDDQFTTEIRVPLPREIERELAEDEGFARFLESVGARIEERDLAIELHGAGGDADASVDARADVWREVTGRELVDAYQGAEFSVGMRYLMGNAEGDDPVLVVEETSPVGDADAGVDQWSNLRLARIRPEAGGVLMETSALRPELDDVVGQRAAEYFGGTWDGEAKRAWFPVTTDPHADVNAARSEPGRPAGLSDVATFELLPAPMLARLPEAPSTAASELEARMGGLSLAEKRSADGDLMALVWVDSTETAQSHPDLPSMWMDGAGGVGAFGNYADGVPVGTWGWTGPDGHDVLIRATLGPEGVSGVETRSSASAAWAPADDATIQRVSTTGPGKAAVSGPPGPDPSPSAGAPRPRLG